MAVNDRVLTSLPIGGGKGDSNRALWAKFRNILITQFYNTKRQNITNSTILCLVFFLFVVHVKPYHEGRVLLCWQGVYSVKDPDVVGRFKAFANHLGKISQ